MFYWLIICDIEGAHRCHHLYYRGFQSKSNIDLANTFVHGLISATVIGKFFIKTSYLVIFYVSNLFVLPTSLIIAY